jgi:hypothetical protein
MRGSIYQLMCLGVLLAAVPVWAQDKSATAESSDTTVAPVAVVDSDALRRQRERLLSEREAMESQRSDLRKQIENSALLDELYEAYRSAQIARNQFLQNNPELKAKYAARRETREATDVLRKKIASESRVASNATKQVEAAIVQLKLVEAEQALIKFLITETVENRLRQEDQKLMAARAAVEAAESAKSQADRAARKVAKSIDPEPAVVVANRAVDIATKAHVAALAAAESTDQYKDARGVQDAADAKVKGLARRLDAQLATSGTAVAAAEAKKTYDAAIVAGLKSDAAAGSLRRLQLTLLKKRFEVESDLRVVDYKLNYFLRRKIELKPKNRALAAKASAASAAHRDAVRTAEQANVELAEARKAQEEARLKLDVADRSKLRSEEVVETAQLLADAQKAQFEAQNAQQARVRPIQDHRLATAVDQARRAELALVASKVNADSDAKKLRKQHDLLVSKREKLSRQAGKARDQWNSIYHKAWNNAQVKASVATYEAAAKAHHQLAHGPESVKLKKAQDEAEKAFRQKVEQLIAADQTITELTSQIQKLDVREREIQKKIGVLSRKGATKN